MVEKHQNLDKNAKKQNHANHQYLGNHKNHENDPNQENQRIHQRNDINTKMLKAQRHENSPKSQVL